MARTPKKISELDDGLAPQAGDEFPVERTGSNFRLDWASLITAISTLISAAFAGIRVSAGTLDPTTFNVVIGHAANVIAGGDANTVSGGGNGVNNNRMTGVTSYRTIGGGYDNLIQSCIASTIGGGAHHQILEPVDHATIGGGSFNLIDGAGHYSTIGGGSTNHCTATQGTIAGGVSNIAGDTATVGGGSTNQANGQWSTIGGGINHTLSATSPSATIAGGNTHTTTNAPFSAIGGGFTHLLGTASKSALGATIAGGYQNTIAQAQQAQYSTISGGRINSIEVDYGHIPGGFQNSVTGAFGCASGAQAKASIRGQWARSSGAFVNPGDSQVSVVHAFKITTTAAPTNLAVDGLATGISMPLQSAWAFECVVVAARTDVIGEYAKYSFKGLITRLGGVATVVMQQVTSSTDFETTAAWDCTMSADTVAGGPKITATGEAGKTIRWVARLDLTELQTS